MLGQLGKLLKLNPSRTPKKFNPEDFQQDMMRLSPRKSAEVTLEWRERAMNAVSESDDNKEIGMNVALGSVGVLVLGMADGHDRANAAALEAAWLEGGAVEAERDIKEYPTPWSAGEEKDPRKLLGFLPKTVFYTAVTAGLGLIKWGGQSYVRSAALAGTYYIIGNVGQSWAFNMRAKKLAEAPEEEARQEVLLFASQSSET